MRGRHRSHREAKDLSQLRKRATLPPPPVPLKKGQKVVPRKEQPQDHWSSDAKPRTVGTPFIFVQKQNYGNGCCYMGLFCICLALSAAVAGATEFSIEDNNQEDNFKDRLKDNSDGSKSSQSLLSTLQLISVRAKMKSELGNPNLSKARRRELNEYDKEVSDLIHQGHARRKADAEKIAEGIPYLAGDNSFVPNPYGRGSVKPDDISKAWDGEVDFLSFVGEGIPGHHAVILRQVQNPDIANLGEAVNHAELVMGDINKDVFVRIIELDKIRMLWPAEQRQPFLKILQEIRPTFVDLHESSIEQGVVPLEFGRIYHNPHLEISVGPSEFCQLVFKKQTQTIIKMAKHNEITQEFLRYVNYNFNLLSESLRYGFGANSLWYLTSIGGADKALDLLVGKPGLITEDLLLSAPTIVYNSMEPFKGKNVLFIFAWRKYWENIEKLVHHGVITPQLLNAKFPIAAPIGSSYPDLYNSSAWDLIQRLGPPELSALINNKVLKKESNFPTLEIGLLIAALSIFGPIAWLWWTKKTKTKMIPKPSRPKEVKTSHPTKPKTTVSQSVQADSVDPNKQKLVLFLEQLKQAQSQLLSCPQSENLQEKIAQQINQIQKLISSMDFNEQTILNMQNKVNVLLDEKNQSITEHTQTILEILNVQREILNDQLKTARKHLERYIPEGVEDILNAKATLNSIDDQIAALSNEISLSPPNLEKLQKIQDSFNHQHKHQQQQAQHLINEAQTKASQLRKKDHKNEDKEKPAPLPASLAAAATKAGLLPERKEPIPSSNPTLPPAAPAPAPAPRNIRQALELIAQLKANYEKIKAGSPLKDYMLRGCLFYSAQMLLEKMPADLKGYKEMKDIRDRLVHHLDLVNQVLKIAAAQGKDPFIELANLLKDWTQKLDKGASLRDLCSNTFSTEELKGLALGDICHTRLSDVKEVEDVSVNEASVRTRIAKFKEAQEKFKASNNKNPQMFEIASSFFASELSSRFQAHPGGEADYVRQLVNRDYNKMLQKGDAYRHDATGLLSKIFSKKSKDPQPAQNGPGQLRR